MLLTVLPAVRGEERNTATISGKILSSEHEAMDFATVQIKGTGHGTRPDAKGIYHLHAKAGTHTLVFKAMGYETVERTVTLTAGERRKLNVSMQPRNIELAEVKVEANHVSRVNRSAFNAVALDLKGMAGLSKNLAEVLTSVPGVKLRETGGMGSDMQLMLDGFSGRHVKVFIDGVPQEGAETALDLNNLPVNFAERIEVYRGVVPVGFGTDAIGGVVNIVTNQQRQRWFADASYSYGSFNTHKSSLRFRTVAAPRMVLRSQRLPELLRQRLPRGQLRDPFRRGWHHGKHGQKPHLPREALQRPLPQRSGNGKKSAWRTNAGPTG